MVGSDTKRGKRRRKASKQVARHPWFGTVSFFPHSLAEWSSRDTRTLLVVVLLAGVLRFYGFLTHSLWVDEILAVRDARGTFLKHFYLPHVLFFLSLRAMLLLGESEPLVRFPSLLSGLLAVGLIYLLAFRLFGRGSALAASLLMALSPFHLHFSMEARYYAHMVLFSLLTFYAGIAFLQQKKWWMLLVAILSALIGAGIHPSCFVYLFFAALFLGGVFLWMVNYREIWSWVKHYKLLAAISLFSVIWAFVFGILVLSRSNLMQLSFAGVNIPELLVQLWRRLAAFPHIEMTPGVSFSPGFLLRIFSSFPNVQGYRMAIVSWSFGLVFLTGLVALVRERRYWFLLWFWLCYLVTIMLLFLFQARIPFTAKYVIYLYPFYLLLVARGIGFIVERAGRSGEVRTAVVLMVVFILHLPLFPQIARVMLIDYCPYKKAVRYIMRNSPDNKFKVFCNSGTEGAFRYYARRLGLPDSAILPFDEEFPVGPYPMQWVACSFFIGDAEETVSGLLQRIGEYYDQDRFFTAFPLKKFYSVRVFRPQETRVVLPARIFSTSISADLQGQWHKRLFCPIGGDYTAVLSIPAPISDKYQIAFNDILYQPDFFSGDQLTFSVELPPGENLLQIRSQQVQALRNAEPIDLTLRKGPLKKIFPGSLPEREEGSAPRQRINFKGKNVLFAEGNSRLSYPLHGLSAGIFKLSVEALHDVPPPVLLGVELEGKMLALLPFEEGNNDWGERFCFFKNLAPATRHLTLSFLNDINVGRGRYQKNRQLYLGNITVKKVSNEKPERDHNVLTHGQWFLKTSPDHYNFVKDSKPNPLWNLETGEVAMEYQHLNGRDSLCFTIPPHHQGFGLLSHPLEVPEELTGFYFSYWCCARTMHNHTMNMMVFYKDDKDNVLDYGWLDGNGITGDQDWIRMTSMRRLPRGCSRLVLGIDVHPNSSQPGWQTQYLYLSSPSFSRPGF